MDPFGTLGMVYLELHKASDLKDLGITVQDLYDSDTDKADAVDNYWANFNAAFRTSVSTYDSSYVFNNGITPATEYYVVLAHVAEDEMGSMERTLDDYYRLVTPQLQNRLAIDYVNTGAVGVTLLMDSLEGEPSRLEMTLNGAGGSPQVITRELTADDLKKASSGGVLVELPIKEDQLAAFKATQVLEVKLLDVNDAEMMTARCINNFYTTQP